MADRYHFDLDVKDFFRCLDESCPLPHRTKAEADEIMWQARSEAPQLHTSDVFSDLEPEGGETLTEVPVYSSGTPAAGETVDFATNFQVEKDFECELAQLREEKKLAEERYLGYPNHRNHELYELTLEEIIKLYDFTMERERLRDRNVFDIDQLDYTVKGFRLELAKHRLDHLKRAPLKGFLGRKEALATAEEEYRRVLSEM